MNCRTGNALPSNRLMGLFGCRSIGRYGPQFTAKGWRVGSRSCLPSSAPEAASFGCQALDNMSLLH
jgi:hypothetical protein